MDKHIEKNAFGYIASLVKGRSALVGLTILAAISGTACNSLPYQASPYLKSATPSSSFAEVKTPASNPASEPTGAQDTLPATAGEKGQPTETVTRNFSWEYYGPWNWSVRLPVSLYEYYRRLPRPPTMDYSIYVTNPWDDAYIDLLATNLVNAAKQMGYSAPQTVLLAASFVQTIPYTDDNVTTPFDEYPRYPLETLVENGGDCEDTSILLASILDRMDFDVVLIRLPGHIGVGVKESDNTSGLYWEFEGERYYYIEATGDYWGIGKIPEEYGNSSAWIFPIRPVPVIVHKEETRRSGPVTTVTFDISNLGTAPASNITTQAGFDAGQGLLWNLNSESFSLGISQQVKIVLNTTIPIHQHTRLVTRILADGVLISETFSDWFDT